MTDHTILFIQAGPDPETKTYSKFNTFQDCLDSVAKIFEEHLMQAYPFNTSLHYDVTQLFAFLDGFHEISCLVYDLEYYTYKPYNKEKIKEGLYVTLELKEKPKV